MQNNLRNYAKIFASLHLEVVANKRGLEPCKHKERQTAPKGGVVSV